MATGLVTRNRIGPGPQIRIQAQTGNHYGYKKADGLVELLVGTGPRSREPGHPNVPLLIVLIKLNLNKNSKYFNHDRETMEYYICFLYIYLKKKKRTELMVRPVQPGS